MFFSERKLKDRPVFFSSVEDESDVVSELGDEGVTSVAELIWMNHIWIATAAMNRITSNLDLLMAKNVFPNKQK